MNDADVCFLVAGRIGPVWRKYRKLAPPEVRDKMAEFLLVLRLYVLPAHDLDCVACIGRSRYDIRGVAQLLARVAGACDGGDAEIADKKYLAKELKIKEIKAKDSVKLLTENAGETKIDRHMYVDKLNGNEALLTADVTESEGHFSCWIGGAWMKS